MFWYIQKLQPVAKFKLSSVTAEAESAPGNEMSGDLKSTFDRSSEYVSFIEQNWLT